MATPAPPSLRSFTAPRYWPTWLGIAALCVCAWLPFRLRMGAGTLLGLATYALARERRYITEVNIALCFPELDAAAQRALVRQCFIDNGIGLIETATGWMRPTGHFRKQVTIYGKEHFDAALAAGRGVLLLGAHYSTLDFGANLFAATYPFAVTYRPHRNPLFNAFMLRGRLSNCNGVFDRNDIRSMFRHLKQNQILWYAPDQDYGPDGAVYVPFFGQRAATLTAASRFANFNKSTVLVAWQHRDTANKHYNLGVRPLPEVPSGDDVLDATLINQALEEAIRREPSQYLWMHKRFKTQPGGKPESPYIFIKTPNRRLNEAQYAGMLADATQHEATGAPLLASGLVLREFPKVPGKFRARRHPALQFDLLSKQLRGCGVRTVTVDNIFRVPSRGLTAVTCFMPQGAALKPGMATVLAATTLLANLHNNGFHFATDTPQILVADDGTPIIADPLHVTRVPGSASYRRRLHDLRIWANLVQGSAATLPVLIDNYVPLVRHADAAGFAAWLAARFPGRDNAGSIGGTHS